MHIKMTALCWDIDLQHGDHRHHILTLLHITELEMLKQLRRHHLCACKEHSFGSSYVGHNRMLDLQPLHVTFHGRAPFFLIGPASMAAILLWCPLSVLKIPNMECNIRLGSGSSRSQYTHGNLLGDLGWVSAYITWKGCVRVKWRRGEWFRLFWVPIREKGVYKWSK